MSDKYEELGLNKFLKLVDSVIDDLESGRAKGTDVKPKFKPKTIEDTVVRSSATESGEDNYDNVRVIGKAGKRLVVVTPADGGEPTIYGSPSVAAREVGLTPTTIGKRCEANKVDAKGNTWSYQDTEVTDEPTKED